MSIGRHDLVAALAIVVLCVGGGAAARPRPPRPAAGHAGGDEKGAAAAREPASVDDQRSPASAPLDRVGPLSGTKEASPSHAPAAAERAAVPAEALAVRAAAPERSRPARRWWVWTLVGVAAGGAV